MAIEACPHWDLDEVNITLPQAECYVLYCSQQTTVVLSSEQAKKLLEELTVAVRYLEEMDASCSL
jgi:hypothetical protein